MKDDLLEKRQVLAKDENGGQPLMEGGRLIKRISPPVELSMEEAIAQLRQLRAREREAAKAAEFWMAVISNWKRETAELR